MQILHFDWLRYYRTISKRKIFWNRNYGSKNVALLSLWSKRAIIAPNNLIDSHHYKRHKKIRMTEFHSPSLSIDPHNHAVKSIILILILNYSKMIPRLVESFRNLHLFHFFKRDKNVGNFLVRSALKTNEQPGTFKCARSQCKTCLFIVNTSKRSGPKRSVKITDRFTCTFANVIYCITCTLCKKLYIGETGRRLGDRFREHLRDVEKNDKDASKPVARHFNLPNHSKKHMAICGLSLGHLGTTESRKNLEQKFIFQIDTLNPHGVNERFSFN